MSTSSSYPIKISVVIPVFNIVDFLPICLDSVLKQTYKNIEVILIDDGSTDGSEKICDQFLSIDSRVKVYHKNNTGVSDSRNLGVRMSNGDYVCFIDGDDFIEHEYFENAVTVLSTHSPTLLINSYKLYYANNKTIDTFKKGEPKQIKKEEFLKGIFEGLYYNWAPVSKFYHLSIIRKVTFNPKYSYGEDLLFIFDLIKILSEDDIVFYAPICSYMYFQRESSACYSYPIEKKYDCIKICEYIIRNADSEISEYVYLNYYLRFLIRLKYRMLECNYDKMSAYYIKCSSVSKENWITNLINPKMNLKAKVLLILNLLPDKLFHHIVSLFIKGSSIN